MSETKPPSAAAEKMAKDLKSTLVQRRPRPWKAVLLALTVFGLLVGGAAWWFGPVPRLEPLQIVALDELCAAAEKPRIRAQLYAPVPEEPPRPMGGLAVFFLEPPPLLGPASDTFKVTVASGEQGQASADWLAPKARVADFRAEYIDKAAKAKSLDHARLFECAKDGAIFVVDVDETLKGEGAGEAAQTLARAARAGWQIVYLAAASARPVDYRKARDWVNAQPNLPPGPVLGRREFSDKQTSDTARRAVLQALRSRFNGNLAAIVKTADAALISKDAGLQTYQLSADPIAGVVGIASWADLPVRSKK